MPINRALNFMDCADLNNIILIFLKTVQPLCNTLINTVVTLFLYLVYCINTPALPAAAYMKRCFINDILIGLQLPAASLLQTKTNLT